ncbi:MAG: hypothetical protein ACREKH_12390, partial [Candidatus Rokuibacteriota bacterium]
MTDSGRKLPIGVDWILVGALAIGAIASVAYAGSFDALEFDQDALMNLGDVLAPLVVIAAFIERAVEVILTPVRGDRTEHLRAQIALAKRAKRDTSADEEELRRHRQASRRIAFVIAVALGLMASLVGFRGLSNFVASPDAIPAAVAMLDVFLTGLLLG